MAHADNGMVLPFKAASAIGQGVVAVMPLASPVNETVIAGASSGFFGAVIGITQATQPTYGYDVAVIVSGVAKCRAAASLGAGAQVGAASVNGALGPLLPSGVLASAGPSAGLQLGRFVVGKALTSAAAGEYFACLIEAGEIF